MNQRPRSVTVISVVFIAFGGIALLTSLLPPADAASAQRVAEFKAQHPFEYAPVLVARVLAVLCGVFMLCGFNWARWLLMAWMGYHVIIGFLHSPWSALAHSLLFSVVVFFLFRPRASAYFRGSRAEPPQVQKPNDIRVV